MSRGIFWFRQDLRLSDNPALCAACEACEELLCIFIDDPMEQSVSRLGAASRVWLHHSLTALRSSLQRKGAELYIAQGDALEVLRSLIQETGAQRIFWNRCYDPATIERDKRIKSELVDLSPQTFNALLIHEPWENRKSDGSVYRVYTPYWRAAARMMDEEPSTLDVLRVPRRIPALPAKVSKKLRACLSLDALGLLPSPDWHTAMIAHWRVGEEAGRKAVDRFVSGGVNTYDSNRDLPGVEGTSRLSPHLHFGELSARYVMHRLLAGRPLSVLADDETVFAKELVWREFAYAILYHFPRTIDEPMDPRFVDFPWAEDASPAMTRWQSGHTGVPIVDAGMRQLYATGWMHNRVRMIVASYLVKNLLLPWQHGENWFRDALVDADLASNSMGWQWSAGCGVDAAPFFRVFNPVLQGQRFDAQGDYVRRWVPELADVPSKKIHSPWELDSKTRNSLDYCEPLVDLKVTRQRALEAFAQIKGRMK